jgi:hypothetical protein
MFMAKQALSVTLEESNILWLRARARSGRARNLSDALDGIVTAARRGGGTDGARTVVGTIDIAATDPDLTTADAAIRSAVDAWLAHAGDPPAPRPPARRRAKPRAARRG